MASKVRRIPFSFPKSKHIICLLECFIRYKRVSKCKKTCSGVARGWAMGHLHPPSQSCYTLDWMQFFHLLYKIWILIAFFSQKCSTAPPRQISGYATAKMSINDNIIRGYRYQVSKIVFWRQIQIIMIIISIDDDLHNTI